VYDSFGTIIYALLNAPGSQHDSTLAAGLYDLLRSKTSKGFALAADAAFCSKGELKDKVWKPLTTTQLRRASDDDSISVRKLVAMLKKHRAAVSVRQGANPFMHACRVESCNMHACSVARCCSVDDVGPSKQERSGAWGAFKMYFDV